MPCVSAFLTKFSSSQVFNVAPGPVFEIVESDARIGLKRQSEVETVESLRTRK